MALKLNSDEEHDNNERWLLTYSDLITLLMIFFIVMYAMSNVDQAKYHKLADSLNSALAGDNQMIVGGAEGTPVEVILKNKPSDTAEKAAKKTPEEDLIRAAATVKALMKEKGLESEVSVNISERGVVISLKDTILFGSGSSIIRQENIGTLVEIGDAIRTVDNFVRVEGNTDDVPIHNSIFSNNWELSVMRAATVLDLMVKRSGFPPEKISAIGYGEYRPVESNATAGGKTKNRRVDIVILNKDYNKSESL